eukprot:gene23301-biopygen107753
MRTFGWCACEYTYPHADPAPTQTRTAARFNTLPAHSPIDSVIAAPPFRGRGQWSSVMISCGNGDDGGGHVAGAALRAAADADQCRLNLARCNWEPPSSARCLLRRARGAAHSSSKATPHTTQVCGGSKGCFWRSSMSNAFVIKRGQARETATRTCERHNTRARAARSEHPATEAPVCVHPPSTAPAQCHDTQQAFPHGWMRRGLWVILCGLRRDTRLNGEHGRLLAWDGVRQRLEVALLSGGCVRAHPTNVCADTVREEVDLWRSSPRPAPAQY